MSYYFDLVIQHIVLYTFIMKISIFLITGFLCSGKTTLLRTLVQSPQFKKSAIIINEFGEIGLDHDLIREIEGEQTTLLNAGCVCCTIRSDLVDILHDLFLKRVRMQIPEFQSVFIEATGIADPVSLVQTLMHDSVVTSYYQLEGILNLIDAQNVLAQLPAHPTVKKQILLADDILLTKTDLIDEIQHQEVRRTLRAFNPNARIHCVTQGQLDPQILHDFHRIHLEHFLTRVPAHPHVHTPTLLTFNWERGGKMACSLTALHTYLKTFLKQNGLAILRLKGIFHCDGEKTPFIFQGMQHILYPHEAFKISPTSVYHNKLVILYDTALLASSHIEQLSDFLYKH